MERLSRCDNRRNRMTIGKAITILVDKYEYAKTQDWIINKVAWALYQTWKEVDEKAGETE